MMNIKHKQYSVPVRIHSRDHLDGIITEYEEIKIIETQLVNLQKVSLNDNKANLLNRCYISGLTQELDNRRASLAYRGVIV